MNRLLLLLLFVFSNSWAANLIPNSSFECGTGRGWNQWGNEAYSGAEAYGNDGQLHGYLTNNAYHGAKSFRIISRLRGRAIYLTNGTYTFSFYARTANGNTEGPYSWELLRESDFTQNPPPVNDFSSNFTGTWTRYINQYTAPSNGFYYPAWLHGQPACLIDAIQVEAGTNATAYAPQQEVEVGLYIPNTNNMWFLGDTAKFDLKFWNEGPAKNPLVLYDVYDAFNSNVLSSSQSPSLAATTNTTVSVNLPSARYGHFKVQTRMGAYQDAGDAVTTVVYPYASNVTVNANDWLGGHPHASDFHAGREVLARRTHVRTLSPAFKLQRWPDVEPERGNFVWNDGIITGLTGRGVKVVMPLAGTDGAWNPWATNADGTADFNAYSNYCYQVANRYQSYDPYYGIWNEAYQTGPFTPPIDVSIATNYLKVLRAGIAGITNADTTAPKILLGSGSYGDGAWHYTVWTNLTAHEQSFIVAVEFHNYPKDNTADPNDPFLDRDTSFTDTESVMGYFRGIKPVWNSESGTSSSDPDHTLNTFWLGHYDHRSTFTPEAKRAEGNNRHPNSLVRILTEALSCIGWGAEKFFYYDSRFFNDASYLGSPLYGADYHQVDKPAIVALSCATHFIQTGFGRLSNPNSSALDMFSFTNRQGTPVVAAWMANRTNATLTVTNNAIGQYDCFGNSLATNQSTFKVDRFPCYFVSGTLSLSQLTNTLGSATVTNNADVLPPQTSIDIAPSGLWTNNTARLNLLKWTALDRKWATGPPAGSHSSATNILFDVTLDGAVVGSNKMQNTHWWLPSMSDGNHTNIIIATDLNGNSSTNTYVFSPAAAEPPPPATNITSVTYRLLIGSP